MKILDPVAAAAVVVRPAATTIIVRDGPTGLEMLMVRRSLQASFMPGAYVFPGGAVEPADADEACDEDDAALLQRIGGLQTAAQARAFAVAALRECSEECSLWLGADRVPPGTWATSVLQPWSRWVTPFGIGKRFDTFFFVAPAPADQTAAVDAGETTALAWVSPAQALAEHAEGRFQVEFATARTIESVAPYGDVAALLAEAATRRHLQPVHPRVQLDAAGGLLGVVLPGQPGYEQAFHAG